MHALVVIPARWAATRFPGKPLLRKTDKYLIQHVYERACRARLAGRTIVATDDQRIVDACQEFAAECVLTSREHPSGTDRVAEVVQSLREDIDVVVNVQGDEPEISPEHIDLCVERLRQTTLADMVSLMTPLRSQDSLDNPNVVKVVTDCSGQALYFSRSAIPYVRNDGRQPDKTCYFQHIGLYGYRVDCLLRLCQLTPSPLEQAEQLEQLRALENGFRIVMVRVDHAAEGIDIPEQYEAFVQRWNRSRPVEDPTGQPHNESEDHNLSG